MKQGSLRRTHPTTGEWAAYCIEVQDNHLTLVFDDESLELEISQENSNSGWCRWKEKIFPFAFEMIGKEIHIWLDGNSFTFISGDRRGSRQTRRPDAAADPNTDAAVTSEIDSRAITTRISGLVLLVCVGAGDVVSAGDEICVIESMKMEHSIRSNFGGTVGEVLVRENQQVSAGDVLISFKREPV